MQTKIHKIQVNRFIYYLHKNIGIKTFHVSLAGLYLQMKDELYIYICLIGLWLVLGFVVLFVVL